MSKTYSAGIVTAYGAAKRAGYHGTYEDFCRQQAGYAGNAAAVEAAKTAAQTAANTATTKAGEATTAATAAQTANTLTEAAASQALTDIGTAESGAISAIQTEGATQTANATAQAQAAATSATTASTKASEASASATTATTKATEAAASATSAAQSASNAQAVLESIPEDYSDLSEDVDQLKDDLDAVMSGDNSTREYPTFQLGYLHDLPNRTPSNPGHIGTGDTSICTTGYISVSTAQKIYFDDTTYKALVCYYDAEKTYVKYTSHSTVSPLILDTQYAYCVPEIKKLDNSVFSSVPEEPAYYNVELEMDIARSADIERVEAELRKPIQPSLLPNLPLGVFRSITGYSCELPYTSLDGYARFYVDSENGLDTNSGTSDSPVKTITKAVNLMRNAEVNSVIEITNGSIFYAGDITSNGIGTSKNLIIRSNGRATLIAGDKPTFTQSGSHYVSETITDHTIMGCVNMGATDDYGVHAPMIKVDSIEAVDETDNSYYIDSTNKIVYVHPSTQIADVVVLFSDKYALQLIAASLSESGFVMCENLTLIGNSTFTGRASSTVGETIQRTAYVKNCIFEHGITSNIVSFNDYEYTYLVDCVSGYGKNDCYNYHFTRKPTPTLALVVEVNCVSKESGYYNANDGSDNLSTCHDEANILRCGCHGYNGNGSMCADADGCYSVCVDCTYVNTSYNRPSGANRSAFEFYNSAGQRNGKAMMQNCFGYDTRNNKLVKAVDLILSGVNVGGTIDATNVTVAKEVL